MNQTLDLESVAVFGEADLNSEFWISQKEADLTHYLMISQFQKVFKISALIQNSESIIKNL